MFSFLIQCGYILFVVILQISLLNAGFVNVSVNAILAAVVSLTVIRGFVTALPLVVMLGLVFDMITFDTIGISALVLLLCAYGISFVSRRFFMEHQTSGIGLALFFTMVVSVAYFPLEAVMRYALLGVHFSQQSMMIYFSAIPLLYSATLNAIIFIFMYFCTLKMHRALDFYLDRVVVRR